VTTIVHNTGKEVMPFAIGAHPGFHLGASIEAYQLEIPGARMWQRHLIQSGLYTGKTEPIEFDAQGKLDLNDALFAEDAIVFKHQGIKQVRLWEHQKPLLEFTIYGEPAPYWGFWKKPGAPFLCIEPWWGIADSIHSNGRIFDKEGMFRLNEGDSKIFKYGMRILL
jgi:galactose mutarotase-like enzyme